MCACCSIISFLSLRRSVLDSEEYCSSFVVKSYVYILFYLMFRLISQSMCLPTKKLYYVLLRKRFVSPTKYYNANATMRMFHVSLFLRISHECMESRDLFMEGNRTVIRKYRTCIVFFKVIKIEAIDVLFHLLKMFPKIGRCSE